MTTNREPGAVVAWTEIAETPFGRYQRYSHDPVEQPLGRYILATDYEAMRARAGAAEQDAVRYRFLRNDTDSGLFDSPYVVYRVKDEKAVYGNFQYAAYSSDLDAKIDTAIAEQERGG